ncbi:MAG: NADH-quinone oxidoreductase subunit J [Chitinophagaceae bacterium]
MSASQIMFYILSAFILGSGLLAVTTRKIFRAAIWLLFSLMCIAGLYFWMELAFIAAVQIIVYVGGIVVLIIFSIFLTQQSGKEMPSPVATRSWVALLTVLVGFALTSYLVYNNEFSEISKKPFTANVADIGTQMLSTSAHGYVLPFELVSMLLLAAMIGCIVIAMKETRVVNTEGKTGGEQ